MSTTSSSTESITVESVDACPACSERQRRSLYESFDWLYGCPGTFPLSRCARCSSVYPTVRPTAETLGDFYPESSYYAYSASTPHRLFVRGGLLARAWYAAKKGLLRSHYGYDLGGSQILGRCVGVIPPLARHAVFSLDATLHPYESDGALLDVGCGSGDYLDLMRALGWKRVVGVDISERGVTAARDLLGLEAHQGQLAEIGFPDATFDAITMSHTLEHVADPVALLSEARRILRPGGRVAILVPNVRSLGSRVFGRYWLGLDTPRHLVCFAPSGLRRVIERSGLTLESLHTPSSGSAGVAAFSLSRACGDDRSVYTDADHRFSARRRTVAAAHAGCEGLLCTLGLLLGEQIAVVARR